MTRNAQTRALVGNGLLAGLGMGRILCGLVGFVIIGGCMGTPPLERQERLVQEDQIQLHRISSRAFVNIWGKPAYHHSEITQFFVMKDGAMIPRTRVPTGEVPAEWEGGFDAGEGVFFAYPDRGWLLVFYQERLVHREQLTAEQLHALGKTWQHEERFKTRLDKSSTP